MISPTNPRILFVGVSLRRGGAERVATLLLQRLAALRTCELHLALLEHDGPFLAQLPPAVVVHTIGTRRPVPALMRLFRLLRMLQPDVVFSNGFPINLLTTALRPFLHGSPRLVLREVSVLDVLLRRGLTRVVLQQIARRTFRRADAIVCLSRFMEQDLQAGLRIEPHKLVTISNPVDFAAIARQTAVPSPFAAAGPGPHLVAVGRLARVKGCDRIIQALPSLLSRAPGARLWLIGDGPELPELQQLAGALGVNEHVHFVGQADSPFAWMSHADLFVLASRYEGTPNVLLEAIACRAPIVVLDHPGGSREVMHTAGQEWRVVDDLSVWDSRWFEPPPPFTLDRIRELHDVSHVARQYLDVLLGAQSLREAA